MTASDPAPASKTTKRRRGRAILGGLLLIVGCAGWWYLPAPPERADYVLANPLMERISPDGAWKAYVDQIIHRSANQVTMQAADAVFLMDMHDPSDSVPMMMMTDGHDANTVFPVIVWEAADKLQVTVANHSFVRVLREGYKGIHIDLRFDPEDPAARAAWLRTATPLPNWPAVPDP